MNYATATQWMFQQLPLYQRQGKTAFKADLRNIQRLSAYLDHPEKKFKSIHVAGTNGKGSVCHMLASVFQEAGYKTGLHTSPHLKDFRERIRINGKMIPQQRVTSFIERNKDFLEKEQLSFFEMSVGLTFSYFAEEEVDIAIIETGLGGRLDSTNIIQPELSIITNIGLDHTALLGDTLPKIATEKAGIIKSHTPVVIGQKNNLTTPVFEKQAQASKAKLYFAKEFTAKPYPTDLQGAYQKENQQTVLAALHILQNKGWIIPEEARLKGFLNCIENTGLQGRWQVLSQAPKMICDTAHNKEGLSLVLQQIRQEPYATLRMVIGVVNDKDLTTILPLFPKEAKYYFCEAQIPRRLKAEVLAREASSYGLHGTVFKSVKEALEAATKEAAEKDLIFVGGSTFTVAEAL